MTEEDLRSQVIALYDEYLDKVESLAGVYAATTLYPAVKRAGMRFISGMGTFVLWNKEGTKQIDFKRCRRYAPIGDLLEATVPGTNNCYAEFMMDYDGRVK